MRKSTFIILCLCILSDVLCAQTREYPIQVQLISSPNIINDGVVANSLQIGVFNNIVSATNPNITFPAGKPFYFWFVVSTSMPNNPKPVRPFGLTTMDRIGTPGQAPQQGTAAAAMTPGDWSIVVSAPDNENSSVRRSDLAGWKATPKKDVILKPGEYLTFNISNLVTPLADGYTMGYFLYDLGKGKDSNTRSWYSFGPISKSSFFGGRDKLGVGISNPTAQLEVQADRATEIILKTSNAQNDTTQSVTISRDGRMAMGLAKPSLYRMSLRGSNSYATDNNAQVLSLAPELPLRGNNKPAYNLIKFGNDGDIQYRFLPQGVFKQPTLALSASPGTSHGFYNGDTASFEVNNTTGDAYLKGKLGVGTTPQATLEVRGDVMVKNENGDLLFSVAKDGSVRFAKPLIIKGSSVLGEFVMLPYGTIDDWDIVVTASSSLPGQMFCQFDDDIFPSQKNLANRRIVFYAFYAFKDRFVSGFSDLPNGQGARNCTGRENIKFDYVLIKK